MSFISGAKGSRPSNRVNEVELDLTPVMNLFIILVPSLVSIAILVHVAIIQINLPPSAGQRSGVPHKKDLKLTVSVTSHGYKLSLGETLIDSIPKAEDKFNIPGLINSIIKTRDKIENKSEMVVAVDDGIVFDDVVATIDGGKAGGFDKVSLAAGNNGSNSLSNVKRM